MKLDQKAHRRFMESFVSDDPEKCWEWTGTKNNAGYPLFSYKGRMISALKILFEMYHNRSIPKGWIVTHTCRKVDCMNPEHVYITTRSELTTDLYAKGLLKPASQKGAKNPNAKLTEAQVREIREKKRQGITHMELAKEYGVTKTTISMIHNKKLWPHIQ
jgi:DNA-binding XRE family transcriptional regulator